MKYLWLFSADKYWEDWCSFRLINLAEASCFLSLPLWINKDPPLHALCCLSKQPYSLRVEFEHFLVANICFFTCHGKYQSSLQMCMHLWCLLIFFSFQIHAAGFSNPTPIQAQTWPVALQNRDIVAIAKTGSGKTLGYLIPAFMHLRRCHNNPMLGPTVLVLAPTRELASQIQDEVVKFGRSSGVSCTVSSDLLSFVMLFYYLDEENDKHWLVSQPIIVLKLCAQFLSCKKMHYSY